MADQTAVTGWSGTLTANTPESIYLSAGCDRLEIINRDGIYEIWFTWAPGNVAPAAASVGGDNRMMPAAIGSYELDLKQQGGAGVTVSLVSTGTPNIAVQSDTHDVVLAEPTP